MEGVDINRYAYGGNDPVNKSDPNGHCSGGGPGDFDSDCDGVDDFRDIHPGDDNAVISINPMLARFERATGGGGMGRPHPSTVKRWEDALKATVKAQQMKKNAAEGKRREKEVDEQKQLENPNARIQGQTAIRTKDGKLAYDPQTGKIRRLDGVAIEEGKRAKAWETTSLKADKIKQSQREDRIRASGGNYVRDRSNGNIIRLQNRTRIERRR